MGYEPLYHAHNTNMASECVNVGVIFILSAISYPASTHGIIVKYIERILHDSKKKHESISFSGSKNITIQTSAPSE